MKYNKQHKHYFLLSDKWNATIHKYCHRAEIEGKNQNDIIKTKQQ